MPKIVTYTAITANCDRPRDDILVFGDYNLFTTPVMNAKIYKILPHKFLDCDISIWVDGNIFLNIPQEKLVEEWLGDADMALLKHHHRESIYWEIKWIEFAFKRNKRMTAEIMKQAQDQVNHYREIGIPHKTGMFNCGCIIRRHSKMVNQFNEFWWSEICRWSPRDQLSFPVAKLQYPELKVNGIMGNIRSHPYLRYEKHNI